MSAADPVPNSSTLPGRTWTTTRIIMVVVVILLAVSAASGGLYYYRMIQPQPKAVVLTTCGNGAANYPDCSFFKTTTTVVCSPDPIGSHNFTSTDCRATVVSA